MSSEREDKVTQQIVPCKICKSVEADVTFKDSFICEACVTYIKSNM